MIKVRWVHSRFKATSRPRSREQRRHPPLQLWSRRQAWSSFTIEICTIAADISLKQCCATSSWWKTGLQWNTAQQWRCERWWRLRLRRVCRKEPRWWRPCPERENGIVCWNIFRESWAFFVTGNLLKDASSYAASSWYEKGGDLGVAVKLVLI